MAEITTEKRIFEIDKLEIRAVDGETGPAKIVGYAALFNSRSFPLFGFTEEIRLGAFSETLASEPDTRATFNHDPNYVLGRTKASTLQLIEDERGLHIEIDPPPTQWAADLITSIKRGDISQMSFLFRIPPGGDEFYMENGETIRALKTIDLDHGDIAVVTYPAYPETTAEARSRAEQVANEDTTPDQGPALQVQRRKRQLDLLKLR